MVIILVSGTFLAQSQYYSAHTLDVSVHDNARVATERVADEIRSTMEDGFVVAGPRTMTVRSPIRLVGICEATASYWTVHFDGGASAIQPSEVAGIARRDPSTGSWEYQNTTWAYINGGAGDAAVDCMIAGPADTTGGGYGDFHRFVQLPTLLSTTPAKGDLLMLFRQTTFRIQTSVLDPTALGLFRQPYGGSAVEFATGMDTTAQFQYRTGGTSYADTVTGSGVANIDAVRIVADTRLPARSGGQADATFGWSVNVALRNLP